MDLRLGINIYLRYNKKKKIRLNTIKMFFMEQFVLKLSFSVYWDLNHPVRVVTVLESVAKLVTTLTQVYAVAAVWIFVLFSQLLVGIYREIAFQIESRLSSDMEEKISFLLDSHNQLVGAVNRVRDRFGWILMANTCYMALNLFYTLYYAIEFLYDGYWVAGFHHLLDLFIAFFRLWLGCHSADQMLKKVFYYFKLCYKFSHFY